MENAAPQIRKKLAPRVKLDFEGGRLSNVSADTVFELIRDIKDPEHPFTLEQLSVVSVEHIRVGKILSGGTSDGNSAPEAKAHFPTDCLCKEGLPIPFVDVVFSPTVPHCSMAGIIGLSIRRQLEKYIEGYWIRIFVKEGTHSTDYSLSKQLNDRDRVFAAFENDGLIAILDSCIDGEATES